MLLHLSFSTLHSFHFLFWAFIHQTGSLFCPFLLNIFVIRRCLPPFLVLNPTEITAIWRVFHVDEALMFFIYWVTLEIDMKINRLAPLDWKKKMTGFYLAGCWLLVVVHWQLQLGGDYSNFSIRFLNEWSERSGSPFCLSAYIANGIYIHQKRSKKK